MSKKSDIKVNSAQHQDIAELVRRVRQGDLGGFDELVRRFQRQATAIAYRLLNNVDDAKEVTQDAFLRAFEDLDPRLLAVFERWDRLPEPIRRAVTALLQASCS